MLNDETHRVEKLIIELLTESKRAVFGLFKGLFSDYTYRGVAQKAQILPKYAGCSCRELVFKYTNRKTAFVLCLSAWHYRVADEQEFSSSGPPRYGSGNSVPNKGSMKPVGYSNRLAEC